MTDTIAQEKHAIVVLRKLIGLDTKRTQALKDFAAAVCDLRKRHNDPAGTSGEYKSAIERVYAAVEIPPDSQSSLQASIRYHIGNELRNTFTPEELQAVGLSEKTPLERAREAQAAAKEAAAPTPIKGDEPADTATLVQAAVQAASEGVTVLQPHNPPTKTRRKERRDYAERPRQEVANLPDPLALMGHALDTVRSAASLPDIPATEVATLRDMVRRMRVELERLEARLAEPTTAKPKTTARKAPARQTRKVA